MQHRGPAHLHVEAGGLNAESVHLVGARWHALDARLAVRPAGVDGRVRGSTGRVVKSDWEGVPAGERGGRRTANPMPASSACMHACLRAHPSTHPTMGHMPARPLPFISRYDLLCSSSNVMRSPPARAGCGAGRRGGWGERTSERAGSGGDNHRPVLLYPCRALLAPSVSHTQQQCRTWSAYPSQQEGGGSGGGGALGKALRAVAKGSLHLDAPLTPEALFNGGRRASERSLRVSALKRV